MPRILVIEDNPTNLELMAYLLEASGHGVLRATNGSEGVRLALGESPDLILCDIQLPDIDGFAVLEALRDLPADVPIVAVTAYAMVGDRERILAAGFDGYLAKPIEPQAFLVELETYLGEAS